jgi:hypothetical protein
MMLMAANEVPDDHKSPASAEERFPSVAVLAGAAGKLVTPRTWDEVRGIAQDDRAAALVAKLSRGQ